MYGLAADEVEQHFRRSRHRHKAEKQQKQDRNRHEKDEACGRDASEPAPPLFRPADSVLRHVPIIAKAARFAMVPTAMAYGLRQC